MNGYEVWVNGLNTLWVIAMLGIGLLIGVLKITGWWERRHSRRMVDALPVRPLRRTTENAPADPANRENGA